MRIKILSDLHMEGNKFQYKNHGEDVLLLAGDIHTRNRLHTLLEQVDVPVFFVAGNHEYYHGIFEEVNIYLKSLESKYDFRFLNNEADDCLGVPIYGGTMFSNWELFGVGGVFHAKHQAKDMINDFFVMSKFGQHYEDATWTVDDHLAEYKKFEDGLKLFLKHTEGSTKRIVMSHFMPSEQSSHPRFRGSNLNPYFVSNMEQHMGWDGVWVHGHGHDSVSYDIDGTKVIANPRGYRSRAGADENPSFSEDFVIDL